VQGSKPQQGSARKVKLYAVTINQAKGAPKMLIAVNKKSTWRRAYLNLGGPWTEDNWDTPKASGEKGANWRVDRLWLP
jgi:hypothetical protein